ncbi:carbohydrate binding domain-containing protein [Aquisphaera insulae]|uniref:carbohydrate binding domain-containing protein n=1 Tax=Aquisphaera insulae TaxID=2712864 RepID=UPI0013E9D7B7|nr:carbohydrate binding domain-containing protein [Aquisphaera insulae]
MGMGLFGTLLILATGSAAFADEEGLFPFVVSYDSPGNVTNVAGWLKTPAGADGPIRADGPHLVNDAGPVRFWATNLCFEASFPTHAQADRLAMRLARLGINCVRLHHMDMSSIWGKSPNKLTIDPDKLERLDYLIAQLKKNGVYVNINLHVSRTFDTAEGFSGRDRRPEMDKGLDNFEPRMIELQKKYARDLLAHVNPYTRTPYAREPAVAFVEINNENALHDTWGNGGLDDLPDPYAATFRELWNAWLKKKYGTTERLRAAWNAREVAPGPELIRGGRFARIEERNWTLERDDDDQARWSVARADRGGLLRVVVNRSGSVAWHPQFHHQGIRLRKDEPYTLTFRMRSEHPRKVVVNAMQAHEPWEQFGFNAQVQTRPEWRSFSLTFTVKQDDANARVGWTNLEPDTYELADVSLRTGGAAGLARGQRLEDSSVPVMKKTSLNMTEAARHDFMDFLWDTESAYWWGMARFLKRDLGVKALVTGTQMGWSPPSIQAKLDYVDAHAYWNHPVFPHRAWDSKDWYVEDTALVNEPGGTLARLASTRVAGKPYTVSEYNHPAPISYAAEGFPMIAAFGAFQDWSAIYSFDYSGGSSIDPGKLEGYFDIQSDPTRLVHMPACAAIFTRRDVAPATRLVTAPAARDAEQTQLRQSVNAWGLTTGAFGVDPRWSLIHAIGLDVSAKVTTGGPGPLPAGGVHVSDTGELRWDVTERGAGTFTASTPRTRLFTGFVRGREFDLGGVRLRIGKTSRDWATITMTAIDGPGFDRPGRILIAATGGVQNTGARLRKLDGTKITLDDHWGEPPVLCEGIPAEIELPVSSNRLVAYPLDQAGNRRATKVKVQARGDHAVVAIGPEHRTLWYEFVVE